APHPLDPQVAALEVAVVDVGDLQLAARRRADGGGDLADIGIVEIEAGHRPVRLGTAWLLLDRGGAAPVVEGDDAIALRVAHPVAEDGGAAVLLGRAAQ